MIDPTVGVVAFCVSFVAGFTTALWLAWPRFVRYARTIRERRGL